MKYFYLLSAFLLSVTLFSCGGEDEIIEPNKKPDHGDGTKFVIDETFKASLTFIQDTWIGEYKGYDAAQDRETKIKRKLTLNPNKTYVNVIQGILVASGKNDYIDFEKEEGTYDYNASTGMLTYVVKYDSLIDYQTQRYKGYTKKHYYSPDGNNANDKAVYTEKVQFTNVSGGGASYRLWVTEDTYLQQLTDKDLDLWFTMDIIENE